MEDVLSPLQARSVHTQRRLLDASAKRLVADGLGAYSTIAVAKEAKLSQGAIFKHFPSKSLLLASTVAHLLDVVFERFDRAVIEEIDAIYRASLAERVTLTVGALWAIFRSQELRAVFEVFVAARTDPSLEELLAPILIRHRERIHKTARLLFDEMDGHPDGFLAVDSIVFAMQGAAIGLFGSALRDDKTNVSFFERLALREMTLLEQTKPK